MAASTYVAHAPVSYSQSARYGLAAVLLWLFVGCKIPRLRRDQLVRLVLLAFSGLIGFNVFLIAALRIGDAGTTGAIIGAVPVVLALASPLLVRRRPNLIPVCAAIVVVGGAAVVHGVDGSTPWPAVVWAVMAMLGEVGFSLLAVPLLREMKPIDLSMSVSMVGAVLFAAYGLLVDGLPNRLPSVTESTAVVFLAVVPTAGAFVLWYSSLVRLPTETAGLFNGLVPVSALLTSSLVGATVVTWPRFGGVMLVASGVVLGVLGSRARRERNADQLDRGRLVHRAS